MPLDIRGQPTNEPQLRVGFIGCGSHAFRNIYPTFQFNPIRLVATCDLDATRAEAFAKQFGADRHYTDHRHMLTADDIDAVFIVTNYDPHGRPRYVSLAADCLRAGKHVWMEKPPAASTAEIESLQAMAGDRTVMVGFKKMFFPANQKARELMQLEDFGRPTVATLQYPQPIPTTDEFRRYLVDREDLPIVVGFLDHLCHPVSLLLYLMGMPATLYYERAASSAGVAVFTYADGRVATLHLPNGQPLNAGMERTTILSDRGRVIEVENNLRVTYHRDGPGRGYGTAPSFYLGRPEETSATWEPEFSLGQLYNKGLFLLGYWAEVNAFARAILDRTPLDRAHLTHAWQVTRIFEAFAHGPGKVITI